MYVPQHFSITDEEEIFAFIEANGFGQLISTVEGRLFSSHLPFEVSEDRERLVCHLARQNPQHRELAGQEVLVTLQGPHGYISPGWYAAPGVPTWNYQAVHVRGIARVFDDPERLGAAVRGLAQKYEAGLPAPWRAEFDAAMLGGIVGVDIAIADIRCKYKLSQNRPGEDRARVIAALRALGEERLADAMARVDE